MMRTIQLVLACVAVLVATTAGQVQAGMIYQQGDITGPTTGNLTYDTTYAGASTFGYDDFTIRSAVTVTDVDWWVLAETPNISSAKWQFRSVAFGNTLGSIVAEGSATPTFQHTERYYSSNLAIYKLSLDIADTPLSANSYFFGLQVTSQSRGFTYWSIDRYKGNNLSAALKQDGSLYNNDTDDLQFQLNGETATPATVPEPTSLAIFGIGACVMGLGATHRRRRVKTQATTA